MNNTFKGFNIDLADFRIDPLKIAALTFVVMTVSSRYSPVPDCFAVDAQPSKETIRRVKEM
ncbi:hypothetical protein [Nitrosomonas sp. GH22]|uniref:hypothetical protein n=1 Tax=Nitrosomonas sp. GH22 TaxID=153947 RepID=UPI0031F53F59